MKNDTHSFIIRVWHEAEDREGNIIAWRGSVDHVGSDERIYFQDFDAIMRFIQEQSGIRRQRKNSLLQESLGRIGDEINKFRKSLRI